MMIGSPIEVSFLRILNLGGAEENRQIGGGGVPCGDEKREQTQGWVAEGLGDTSEGTVGGTGVVDVACSPVDSISSRVVLSTPRNCSIQTRSRWHSLHFKRCRSTASKPAISSNRRIAYSSRSSSVT